MLKEEPVEKTILNKILDILHCPICNKSFDFSNHKPVINMKGETQCKNCLIRSLKKGKNNNLMISNLIIELIMQEMYNLINKKMKKDNIIYLKPGIKCPKSPKTAKKYNLPIIALTKIDKNCNSKFISTRDQSGEDSYTTISIKDEMGFTNNSSFQDEYKNFFMNPNDKIKNKNADTISNNKRIISKNIYRRLNYYNTVNDNETKNTPLKLKIKFIDDKDSQSNHNMIYSNKIMNNNHQHSVKQLDKLIPKKRNMSTYAAINDNVSNKNLVKSISSSAKKSIYVKNFNNYNKRSTSANETKRSIYEHHSNYDIKEKIIKFPKNWENCKAFEGRNSSKYLSTKSNKSVFNEIRSDKKNLLTSY